MKTSDPIKDYFEAKGYEYNYLKSINFTKNFFVYDLNTCDIKIVLSKDTDEYSDFLIINCFRAFNLKLENLNELDIVRLHIENISKWQNEGATYKIHDEENDKIYFYCDTVSIGLT